MVQLYKMLLQVLQVVLVWLQVHLLVKIIHCFHKDVDILEEILQVLVTLYIGKNIVNPSALLVSSTLLLRHLGLPNFADKICSAV